MYDAGGAPGARPNRDHDLQAPRVPAISTLRRGRVESVIAQKPLGVGPAGIERETRRKPTPISGHAAGNRCLCAAQKSKQQTLRRALRP
jgi:hypothetical protein